MTTAESRAPRVGIVLLNWNGWRDTIECLESLLRMDYGEFQVAVCDQGSTDDSVDRLREWAAGTFVPELPPAPPHIAPLISPPVQKPVALRVISREESAREAPVSERVVVIRVGENLGSGGGNNVGIRFFMEQPGFGYVWILNNDIVVERDALSELVKAAATDPVIGAVSGQLLDYRDPTFLQAAGGGFLPLMRGFPIAAKRVATRRAPQGATVAMLDWLAGGNVLSPVEALRRVGPIDESFFVYMEDIEHSLRMKRRGYEFAYAERSRVWHKGGATTGYASPRYDYYMVRNTLLLARRIRPCSLPLVFLYSMYRVVMPKVVRGQWIRLRTTAVAVRDFVTGRTGKGPY